MAIYAVIEQNKVINVCVADETDNKPSNWVLLDNPIAGIGWDYVDGVFVDKRPQPDVVHVPQPTKEDLLAQLRQLQQQIASLSE